MTRTTSGIRNTKVGLLIPTEERILQTLLERSWQHLPEKRRSVAFLEVERSPTYKHSLAKKGFPRKSPWHFLPKKKNALTFIGKKGYNIFWRREVTWNTFKGLLLYFLEKEKTPAASLSL
jgi:hypothetical protein